MPQFRNWLINEGPRQAAAVVVGAIGGVSISVLAGHGPSPAFTSLQNYVTDYSTWYGSFIATAAITYVALSAYAFSAATGQELAELVRARSPRNDAQRRRWRWMGIDEVSSAFAYTIVAFILVIAVLLAPTGAERIVPTIAALGTVVGAWSIVLVSFAVRYLRQWAQDAKSIAFVEHGDEPVAFADFVWLAAQLSTSYSSGQAELRASVLRRVSTVHVILAFMFNSFIIVLLVSVALPGLA